MPGPVQPTFTFYPALHNRLLTGHGLVPTMPVIKATDSEFERALADREHVIVWYSADWCGTCRLFGPTYRHLAEAAQYRHIAFLVLDAETSPVARRAARISGLPFFAAFRRGQLLGAVATGELQAVVNLLSQLS